MNTARDHTQQSSECHEKACSPLQYFYSSFTDIYGRDEDTVREKLVAAIRDRDAEFDAENLTTAERRLKRLLALLHSFHRSVCHTRTGDSSHSLRLRKASCMTRLSCPLASSLTTPPW